MPELINQVAFQVIGNDQTISLASMNGQLELNVMEPVLVFNLIQSIEIMKNAFKAYNDFCVKGITANVEHLRDKVLTEKELDLILDPHGMTNIGISGSELLKK